MAIIKIPKPPDHAIDKNRPVSSLLRTQMEHMQKAEFRLPASRQTNIYINAIKTEGEAADYIRKVTQHLHDAHANPAGQEKKVTGRRGKGLQIAASARPSSAPKRKKKTGAKKKAARKRRS